jgi:drug/metabolite transporter (DMT)-like permease
VALLRRLRARGFGARRAEEVALGRRDVPWLAGAVASGGVAGPLLLMIGLAQTSAASASLLLTFEGAATALIAWLFFGEHYGSRLVLGLAFLLAGGAALAWSGMPTLDATIGPLAVVGACIAWALDNNLTRKVSLADPLQIVVAGPVNLALGLWASGSVPVLATSLVAMAVGFVGYGLSLVLFVLALRELGTARTSAYFATAPFLGALAAVIVLGDTASPQLAVAGVLMAIGVWLHLTERHEHEHVHERTMHAHPHMHDGHHQHVHLPSVPPGEPHTHVHEHGALKHAHPHTPDMHHRHRHD